MAIGDEVSNDAGQMDIPSGWPSLAKAAAETKNGRGESKPNILVEGSHCETGRRTRGRKKNLDQYSSLERNAITE